MAILSATPVCMYIVNPALPILIQKYKRYLTELFIPIYTYKTLPCPLFSPALPTIFVDSYSGYIYSSSDLPLPDCRFVPRPSAPFSLPSLLLVCDLGPPLLRRYRPTPLRPSCETFLETSWQWNTSSPIMSNKQC